MPVAISIQIRCRMILKFIDLPNIILLTGISDIPKIITFVEQKKYDLFQVKKALSMREWLPLMGITIPPTLILHNIIAVIKEEL